MTRRTKIVYVANPNNPTGTYLPFDEVRRLHAGLPPARSAGARRAPMPNMSGANDYAAGLELARDAENVVMTRTFSKIYGLAGLRLGWWYGAGRGRDALNRIRGPFNVNGAGHGGRGRGARGRRRTSRRPSPTTPTGCRG